MRIPVQLLRWLGYHWDFARGLLSIPEDKISVFLASISEISSAHIVTARMLAQVTGRIISCMLVFGHFCKIMMKALYSILYNNIAKFFPLCFKMAESFENFDNILHAWAKDVEALNRYQKLSIV